MAASGAPDRPCASTCNSSRSPTAGRSGPTATTRRPRTCYAVQDAIAARIAQHPGRPGRRGPPERRAARAPHQPRCLRLLAARPRVHPAGHRRSRRAKRAASSSGRSRSIPAYARAYAGMSLTHFNEWSCQAWGSGTRRSGWRTTTRSARSRSTRRTRWCRWCSAASCVYRRQLRRSGAPPRTRAAAQSQRHRRARARRPVPGIPG